ncbi:ImuA family protein [Jannaschia pohangensis]|uniref:Protein ImuA n=1 Tax=Jannaschia pohangensis TaxID=390807 RepID=A0A1I3NW27_9RHOB|nr:hypothetical protein [Jannaschia pohangensis]SFJ13367.1 protein ImuA [Jannaschia pohangensis]
MSPTPHPVFTEAFSTARDGAGTGLLLAQLDAVLGRQGAGGKPVLWVQDMRSAQENGLPCLHGIESLGLRMPVLRITARNAVDALWAMEEGLECTALSAVVGEVWGNPRALDFTATKRLALRARRTGVPLWLMRLDGAADLSVAPDRWRVASAPSRPNLWDARAPGQACWWAELFRSRSSSPGKWVASHDRSAHRLSLVSAVSDRPVGAGAGDAPGSGSRAVGGG